MRGLSQHEVILVRKHFLSKLSPRGQSLPLIDTPGIQFWRHLSRWRDVNIQISRLPRANACQHVVIRTSCKSEECIDGSRKSASMEVGRSPTYFKVSRKSASMEVGRVPIYDSYYDRTTPRHCAGTDPTRPGSTGHEASCPRPAPRTQRGGLGPRQFGSNSESRLLSDPESEPSFPPFGANTPRSSTRPRKARSSQNEMPVHTVFRRRRSPSARPDSAFLCGSEPSF